MPLTGLIALGVFSVWCGLCVFVFMYLGVLSVFVYLSVFLCLVVLSLSLCLGVLSGPDAPLWAVTEWIEATVRLPA